MFSKHIYSQRRQQLKKTVDKGIILLLGNEESSMNYKDNLYPFRQDSTFLYFFGIDRPSLMAIIDIENNSEILFGDNLTTEQMVWTGFQEPLELLAEKTGVAQVKRLHEIEGVIKNAQSQNRRIHFLPPYRPEQIDTLHSLLGIMPGALQNRVSVSLIKAIVAQRAVKAPEEIEEITKAVNTTVRMQLAAITMAEEGMTEALIAGSIHNIAIAEGGNLSFPSILTINGQILHIGYSQATLQNGHLVLCDCGAETPMHYAGDLTRTFPVSGRFTSMQKDIYDIVLAAHQSAADMLKPGILYRDVHLFACEKLTEGLKQLGLMKGDVKEAVAQGAHALFFPCGLGHMLGLDTHDMENLGEKYVGYNDDIIQSTQFGLKSLRLGRALEEGFVITVEPGLYFNPQLIDEWAAEKRCNIFIQYDKLNSYKNAGGIRIEEDFVITKNGSLLLGDPLPKTAKEIEIVRAS
jgi:Xaa-Pro aminopeptidase